MGWCRSVVFMSPPEGQGFRPPSASRSHLLAAARLAGEDDGQVGVDESPALVEELLTIGTAFVERTASGIDANFFCDRHEDAVIPRAAAICRGGLRC